MFMRWPGNEMCVLICANGPDDKLQKKVQLPASTDNCTISRTINYKRFIPI